MLNEKRLRQILDEVCYEPERDCKLCTVVNCTKEEQSIREALKTALAHRVMLKKVLQVMEGFDYRANINFTMSDCLGVEIEAKALLKDGEKE